jgi:signal recognition particle receptor subunit beta
MDSARSSGSRTGLTPHKLLIAGGFAVGKTTMVAAISEVRPLLTEERLTTASVGHDYGRITFANELVLYLFGVPGQERFWFMWDELAFGALGAVVLADVRRLDDCFPSVNYFEVRDLPFIIALNCFDGAPRYDPDEVRDALDLDHGVPVVLCDARERGSVKQVLITLIEHVAAQRARAAAIASPAAAVPRG